MRPPDYAQYMLYQHRRYLGALSRARQEVAPVWSGQVLRAQICNAANIYMDCLNAWCFFLCVIERTISVVVRLRCGNEIRWALCGGITWPIMDNVISISFRLLAGTMTHRNARDTQSRI